MYNKAAYATYSEAVIDHVLCDTQTITFAGQTISLCAGLEVGGTDDGIEFIIIDTESGDEYGAVCSNMTKDQMQMCADAANEMFANHVADFLVSDADKANAEYNPWF